MPETATLLALFLRRGPNWAQLATRLVASFPVVETFHTRFQKSAESGQCENALSCRRSTFLSTVRLRHRLQSMVVALWNPDAILDSTLSTRLVVYFACREWPMTTTAELTDTGRNSSVLDWRRTTGKQTLMPYSECDQRGEVTGEKSEGRVRGAERRGQQVTRQSRPRYLRGASQKRQEQK
jgi:hypothetical protein